ncbi:PREDICTED: uncharacterized protein LOC108782710, partial [Cyphomyrmex costatus]|uniref:uncharacterized protein LOC108782710 n=1 Tax=Cyphomyrmex costatus TaxID=456900 RepID=UPI00085225F8
MERSPQDKLNDLTVVNLKDIARQVGVSASGAKVELVARILAVGEDGWRSAYEHLVGGDVQGWSGANADVSEQQSSSGGGASLRSGGVMATPRGPALPPELMEREIDILKREKALLERELSLVRREASMTPSIEDNASDRSIDSRVNIRIISDLLSEFRGDCDSFETWKKQVELLRVTYRLDENSTRILINLRLKNKALSWFHSKSEHLQLSAADLLSEMSRMFDSRPSRLTLRRDFEKRKWRSDETFTEYYHEKVVLANRVSVDEEELVDCLIDGVQDTRMRNQARMLRFTSAVDVLDAFRKLSLDGGAGGGGERAAKGQRPMPKSGGGGISTTGGGTIRCYNCGATGHFSRDCKEERKRARGSCFGCGSLEHRVKECPKSQPGVENTTSVVQPVSPSTPYLVTLAYQVADASGSRCKYSLMAMIDSGSPISLIKSDFVPAHIRMPIDKQQSFFGINGTKLEMLGTFEDVVEISDIELKIKFFVVPNTAITCAALLGRDFTSSPLIEITLGEKFSVLRANSQTVDGSDFAKQILHMSYVDRPLSIAEAININPQIDFKIKERVEKLYNNENIINTGITGPQKEIEMNINLTHGRPISLRPRRLSFADKEKLKQILDKLLQEKIIRSSNSPYAFPIVLVRKKDGESRLCVDYRELNKITVKDNFPTPLIDDHLDRLRGKSYFSSLDLRNGFHHVKVADESIKYTSFVTPLENKILVYLDDILIATENVDEHLEILREVFDLARQHGLQFRLDKCSFLYREIVYLGYSIDKSGIRPSAMNVESVVDFPAPRNAKEVHRFVGLASYFRRFVKNFSIIAKPLYDLIKKNVAFKFGPEENRVFELLKNLLSSQPILAIYSPKLVTELHCDASASGF